MEMTRFGSLLLLLSEFPEYVSTICEVRTTKPVFQFAIRTLRAIIRRIFSGANGVAKLSRSNDFGDVKREWKELQKTR